MKWIVYDGGDCAFVVDSDKEDVLKQELWNDGYYLEDFNRTELNQDFLRVSSIGKLIIY